MVEPATTVLVDNADLPVRSSAPVHNGKVRSVYWLDDAESARLIERRGYAVAPGASLAVMVISDRLSAFDCIWRGEQGLDGVPGKGAALNRIAAHWFEQFRDGGLADNHILEIPHPLVWIVQRARPVRIEAIARQYIAGSLWRAYAAGERRFCGQSLPDGLVQHQRLDELLITPSTKGVLTGIPGVPAQDDANISRADIEANHGAFGFSWPQDVDRYEHLLREGFRVIEQGFARAGQILVDTKFEFGYVDDTQGGEKLIYMDEVGTPDSSRLWDALEYGRGTVVENSKEAFRRRLLAHFPDPDVLLDKDRMRERQALAAETRLPVEAILEVAEIYRRQVEAVTGEPLYVPQAPRQEILDALSDLDLVR